jgi:hypothetical protein
MTWPWPRATRLDVYRALLQVVGPEDAHHILHSPARSLGGRRPADVMDAGDVELVYAWAIALGEGVVM